METRKVACGNDVKGFLELNGVCRGLRQLVWSQELGHEHVEPTWH